MSQHILVYRGFARDPGWCHVIVGRDVRTGKKAVLVGELDDNPGTTVANALAEVAQAIKHYVLNDDADFELYLYSSEGLPDLEPTFYRIEWNGQQGAFSVPIWHVVDPRADAWLRALRDQVRETGYTSQALIAERHLEVIDSRERLDLPTAI